MLGSQQAAGPQLVWVPAAWHRNFSLHGAPLPGRPGARALQVPRSTQLMASAEQQEQQHQQPPQQQQPAPPSRNALKKAESYAQVLQLVQSSEAVGCNELCAALASMGRLHGSSTSKAADREAFAAVRREALAAAEGLSSGACSQLIWASGAVKLAFEQEEEQLVLAGLQRTLPGMTTREVANTLYGMAQLRWHPGEQQLAALLAHALQRAVADPGSMKAQAAATMLWACGALGWKPGKQQLASLTGYALRRKAADRAPLKVQEAAKILWACAKLEWSPSERHMAVLLQRALAPTSKASEGMQVQNAASILWACAKLGWHPHEQQLAALVGHALWRADAMNVQAAANIMWACATLGWNPGEQQLGKLLGQALRQAEADPAAVTTQGAANMLWACAKLGWCPSEQQLASLMQHALRQAAAADSSNPMPVQDAANMLWACGVLDWNPGEQQLAALVGHALRRAVASPAAMKVQEAANIMMACGKLGWEPGTAQMAALLRWAGSHLLVEQASPQGVANFVWGCQALALPMPAAFLERCEAWAAQRLPLFAASNLAGLLYSFAKLRHPASSSFIQQAAEQLLSSRAQDDDQAIANFVWACGELEHQFQPSELDRLVVASVQQWQQQQLWNRAGAVLLLSALVKQRYSMRCASAEAAASMRALQPLVGCELRLIASGHTEHGLSTEALTRLCRWLWLSAWLGLQLDEQSLQLSCSMLQQQHANVPTLQLQRTLDSLNLLGYERGVRLLCEFE